MTSTQVSGGTTLPSTTSPLSATTSTGGLNVPPTPKEVADISLYFLQDEFIKYIFEVRTGASALNAALKASTLSETKTAAHASAIATRDFGIALLEETGFSIGMRLVERLILTRARIWEQRECMKFICKDLWCILFQKQADRLQTNRRGGYVILDNSLPPLRHFPMLPSPADSSNGQQLRSTPLHHLPSTQLAHISGIIRGALTNLGFPCCVTAECPNPPTCSFQIRLK